MDDDWSFLFSSFTEINMLQMLISQINITPLYVNTQWTCRIHISTSHTAKFEMHNYRKWALLLTTLFLQFFTFIHTWCIILYIMVNSLHHKCTRHCTSEIFFNARILGAGTIANYSVLCADRFVFLASCWSQSLSSGCQSTSTKPLLKFLWNSTAAATYSCSLRECVKNLPIQYPLF